MSEHDSVREMLALAVADAVRPEDLRRIEQHAQECDLCRQDLEMWARYAQGLRKLPQPAVPEGLVQRTQARLLRDAAGRRERHKQELFLLALAVFGWLLGLSLWCLLRMAAGGNLVVLGANLASGLTWSLISTVVVWMTAATSVFMLARRREMRGLL
jgi:predicted anti-sigma-YlaC factor YlaD